MKTNSKTMNRLLEIVQSVISLNSRNWNFYIKLFPFVNWMPKQFSKPVIGSIMRKLGAVEGREKHFSQGYVMTLNRNLNYKKKNKNVVLPMTMVEKMIKESKYSVVMEKCFCRDGKKCKNYPPFHYKFVYLYYVQ